MISESFNMFRHHVYVLLANFAVFYTFSLLINAALATGVGATVLGPPTGAQ